MVEDALESHSEVKFDGNETKVVTADSGLAEVAANEREKKVAIRQALEDVDDELGIKHEKKVALIEAGKDTKEKPKEDEKPKESEKSKNTKK